MNLAEDLFCYWIGWFFKSCLFLFALVCDSPTYWIPSYQFFNKKNNKAIVFTEINSNVKKNPQFLRVTTISNRLKSWHGERRTVVMFVKYCIWSPFLSLHCCNAICFLNSLNFSWSSVSPPSPAGRIGFGSAFYWYWSKVATFVAAEWEVGNSNPYIVYKVLIMQINYILVCLN